MKQDPKIYLTKEGLTKITEELRQLIAEERPALSSRLLRAREAGDLSENADYHSAKERQAFVEGRITELEYTLQHAEVAQAKSGRSQVGVGSYVRLLSDGEELSYHLVGALEANPLEGKVSYESPLGKVLLGAVVGDEIEADTPAGKSLYKVLEVL